MATMVMYVSKAFVSGTTTRNWMVKERKKKKSNLRRAM